MDGMTKDDAAMELDAVANETTDSPSPTPSHQPLHGVVVVDLSRYLPGPLVSRLLADLGARVIKVEEPRTGDPSRQAPPLIEGEGSLAGLLLSGHDSIALDLTRDTAQEVLGRLLEEADVLVESFRPGVLARWGFDPESLRRRFPSLVVCSVTGWGQDGPHAARAGHDLTYQALAGSLAAGRGMPATQTADIVGAWSAALSVVAALFRRRGTEVDGGTGDGCVIDQALYDAAGHAAITAWAAEADGPKAVEQPLMLTGAIPCYDLYRTRDGGLLAVAALEPRFWRRFCQAVERKDLLLGQFSQDGSVRQQVADLIASRDRRAWVELFSQHDIPVEPVLSPSEALEHPQMEARGWLKQGAEGNFRLGFPARFDGHRPWGGDHLAKLGQHTDELVSELGLAGYLSQRRQRRGGVGRRFSFRAWLTRRAVDWLARRRSSRP